MFFVINLFLLFIFLIFLIYWNFTNELTSYSFFDIQLRLSDYIFWWSNYNCKILFLTNFLFINIIFWNLFLNSFSIYNLIKYHKIKISLFFYIVLILFTYDFYIQFVIMILFCLLFEIIFFYICYKNVT